MNLELEHQERLAQLLAGHEPQHHPQLQLEQSRAPPEHNGQAQARHRVLNNTLTKKSKVKSPKLCRVLTYKVK